jgi:hypothetical protein
MPSIPLRPNGTAANSSSQLRHVRWMIEAEAIIYPAVKAGIGGTSRVLVPASMPWQQIGGNTTGSPPVSAYAGCTVCMECSRRARQITYLESRDTCINNGSGQDIQTFETIQYH